MLTINNPTHLDLTWVISEAPSGPALDELHALVAKSGRSRWTTSLREAALDISRLDTRAGARSQPWVARPLVARSRSLGLAAVESPAAGPLVELEPPVEVFKIISEMRVCG